MRIIAFTGKKGHGKSTASKKVEDMLFADGQNVVRINFKDSLVKKMRECANGLLKDIAEHYSTTVDTLFDEKPPIMRKLMQFVGTDVYRSTDDNFWVSSWEKKIEPYRRSDVIIIVDDVRFKNEFDIIKNNGGEIYRIVATNKPIPTDVHQSETEMESFECITLIADSKESLEKLIEERVALA